jgi:hypothetical protein
MKDIARQLNVKVEDVEQLVPTTYPVYPDKVQQVQSNQDWKNQGSDNKPTE